MKKNVNNKSVNKVKALLEQLPIEVVQVEQVKTKEMRITVVSSSFNGLSIFDRISLILDHLEDNMPQYKDWLFDVEAWTPKEHKQILETNILVLKRKAA